MPNFEGRKQRREKKEELEKNLPWNKSPEDWGDKISKKLIEESPKFQEKKNKKQEELEEVKKDISNPELEPRERLKLEIMKSELEEQRRKTKKKGEKKYKRVESIEKERIKPFRRLKRNLEKKMTELERPLGKIKSGVFANKQEKETNTAKIEKAESFIEGAQTDYLERQRKKSLTKLQKQGEKIDKIGRELEAKKSEYEVKIKRLEEEKLRLEREEVKEKTGKASMGNVEKIWNKKVQQVRDKNIRESLSLEHKSRYLGKNFIWKKKFLEELLNKRVECVREKKDEESLKIVKKIVKETLDLFFGKIKKAEEEPEKTAEESKERNEEKKEKEKAKEYVENIKSKEEIENIEPGKELRKILGKPPSKKLFINFIVKKFDLRSERKNLETKLDKLSERASYNDLRKVIESFEEEIGRKSEDNIIRLFYTESPDRKKAGEEQPDEEKTKEEVIISAKEKITLLIKDWNEVRKIKEKFSSKEGRVKKKLEDKLKECKDKIEKELEKKKYKEIEKVEEALRELLNRIEDKTTRKGELPDMRRDLSDLRKEEQKTKRTGLTLLVRNEPKKKIFGDIEEKIKSDIEKKKGKIREKEETLKQKTKEYKEIKEVREIIKEIKERIATEERKDVIERLKIIEKGIGKIEKTTEVEKERKDKIKELYEEEDINKLKKQFENNFSPRIKDSVDKIMKLKEFLEGFYIGPSLEKEVMQKIYEKKFEDAGNKLNDIPERYVKEGYKMLESIKESFNSCDKKQLKELIKYTTLIDNLPQKASNE